MCKLSGGSNANNEYRMCFDNTSSWQFGHLCQVYALKLFMNRLHGLNTHFFFKIQRIGDIVAVMQVCFYDPFVCLAELIEYKISLLAWIKPSKYSIYKEIV